MRARRLLLGLCALVAAACAEHMPRAFDENPADGGADAEATDAGTDAETDAGDAGLDAAPSCVPGPGPAIAFAKLNSAPLNAPVESAVHDGHIYVLEQGGRALRVNDDGTLTKFIDVSSIIVAGGETGLLGIAFHPKFETNGFVYLYYTVPWPTQPPPDGLALQSLVVRYQSKDSGLTLDPTTAKTILEVDQPFTNHKGATLQFGPDGFLYWGLGDGGSEGDPQKTGQNTNILLGKILRIDVDHGDPYAIPPSNPFATGALSDGGAAKPEIYAYGFRNPFRCRFDPQLGTLWVGDVGQNLHEEIDTVTASGNYGWSIREGASCYNATTCPGADAGLIDPLVSHTRAEAVTITGGVVYRGTGIPELTGKYVYGDFGLKTYYAIPIDNPAPQFTALAHNDNDIQPTSFTLDATGEILVTDYNSGLYRMIAAQLCP